MTSESCKGMSAVSGIERYNDVKEGDVIRRPSTMVKVERKLSRSDRPWQQAGTLGCRGDKAAK